MLFACVATFVTAASAVDEVGAAENALRIGRDWSFDPAANEDQRRQMRGPDLNLFLSNLMRNGTPAADVQIQFRLLWGSSGDSGG
eukprot:gene25209-13032_t